MILGPTCPLTAANLPSLVHAHQIQNQGQPRIAQAGRYRYVTVPTTQPC